VAERVRKPLDESAANTLSFLEELLYDYHPRDFEVQLKDGSSWGPEPSQFRRFTWRINDPSLLRTAILSANQVALGEAYIHGAFDIEGDIEAAFRLADYLLSKKWSAREKLRLGTWVLRLPSHGDASAVRLHGRVHSQKRDQQAVSYHYDVSNDFYALWLDREMVYSCAYFHASNDDLDTAQRQKLDYCCRKLRLKPGDRLLDIGCGWGGLIIHAAREYGAKALGVTLSRQQRELAQQRIQAAGLTDRCEVSLLDYRAVEEPEGFDKIVSVGMVEHVGESHLPEYFRHAYGLLRPGGVFLNHGIGRAGNRPKPAELTFTDVYVFPDGELSSIATMLGHAEEAGFEVCDAENLREHYVLTLRHWLRRLEAHSEEARQMVGETKYRIWRVYIAGSAHYFQTGRIDLYQTLLVKSDHGKSGLPLTRADWYLG
jgi:cyclopropane-fatty-acyl-phospholipid synthase